MESFDRSPESSRRFLEWRINYPGSFVINIAEKRLMLHLASCGHFDYKDSENVTYAPKRISQNKEELEVWARKQIGSSYKVCRDCKP